MFKPGDKIERDHITATKASGSNEYKNLQVIHKHCHDAKTKSDLKTIKRYQTRKAWERIYKRFQDQFEDSKRIWNNDFPTLV